MDKMEAQIEYIKTTKPNVEKEIAALYKNGFSIIDAIKIVRSGYSITLGEAKRLVSSHESWKNIVENNSALHEEILQLFD